MKHPTPAFLEAILARRVGSVLRWCAVMMIAVAGAACTAPIPLEGRPCPCLTVGYQCCAATNSCLASTEQCPSPDSDQSSMPVVGSSIPDAASSPAQDASVDAAPGSDIDASVREASPDASVDSSVDAAADATPESAAPLDAAPDGAGSRDAAPEATNGLDAAPEATPPLDAAGDHLTADADAAEPPSWHTVGDLSEHLVAYFDLQTSSDGTPYIGMLKLTPPGRARVTIVLRFDGTTWQKVGDDQPGTETTSFALTADGTPYIVLTSRVRTFQHGAWSELPDVGQGLFVSYSYPSIAVDRAGRLHAVVTDPVSGGMGVARFNGTTWDLLGTPNSLGDGQHPVALAFDANNVYAAIDDSAAMQTDIRRFNGTGWDVVGGGPLLYTTGGALTVARDGTAYLSVDSSGLITTWKSTTGTQWTENDRLLGFSNSVYTRIPSIDLAADDSLHIAYLTDRDPGVDLIPGPIVARATGAQFGALPTEGLDLGLFDAIKLKLTRQGAHDVPFVAFSRTNRLIVKKLE